VVKPSGDDDTVQKIDDTVAADSAPVSRDGKSLVVGARIGGRYEIRGLLGTGGMGAVYLAVDEALDGKQVALKLVPRLGLDAIRREVLLAQQVTHPNVCRIYDLEEVDGLWMIKMEHVDGETLAARLERGPLAVGEALAIARQILDGLGAAHAKDVVHRDLKPANVMIDGADRVVLMDFGIARTVSGESAPEIIGTPGYMAPEQLRAEHVDARADLFALGCVLYHVLVGKLPFPAASVMSMHDAARRAPDPRAARADIPIWLGTAIVALLAHDPAQRPADVAAARRLLAGPSPRRLLMPIAIGGSAAAAVIAFALWPRHAWQAKIVRLPSTEENSDSPRFSPDGTHLLYNSDRGQPGRFRIYQADVEGKNEKALTPLDAIALWPSYTPDGASILYSDRARDRSLYTIPLAGGAPTRIADHAKAGTVCGNGLLVTYDRAPDCESCQRLVYRGVDGVERELVRGDPRSRIDGARCDRAATRAAYGYARAKTPFYQPSDVWTVELATSTKRQLTDDRRRNLSPSFSIDGASIIFTSERGGHMNLWEISIAGGEPRQLTDGDGNDMAGEASPDGRAFVYDIDTSSAPLYARTGDSKTRITPARPILATLAVTHDGAEVIATDLGPRSPRVVAISLPDGDIRAIADGTAGAPTLDDAEIVVAAGNPAHVVALPRRGGAPRTIGDLDGEVTRLVVGPDRAVHATIDHRGRLEAWRLPLAGGAATRDGAADWSIAIPAPNGSATVWARCEHDNCAAFVTAGATSPNSSEPDFTMDSNGGGFDATGTVFAYNSSGPIFRFDATTRRSAKVADTERNKPVAISPNGQTIYTAETVGQVQRAIIANFGDRPRP
jgi:serine/threonine protein kinase